MTETKHTRGPWSVRSPERNGEVVDHFVVADDVNGFAYQAEILGEDEYREQSGGLDRKLADCRLIAAAPDMLIVLRELTAIAEKSIYPKPDVGPDHPYSILLRAKEIISRANPEPIK